MSQVKLKTKVRLKIKASNKPKKKTLSSAKKRFSITATGKVKATQSGKQHNLGRKKRTKRSLLASKGTTILSTTGIVRRVKRVYGIK